MMSHRSGVSIIICCYNSEKVIEETLEHIFKQNVAYSLDWEVILVNNGSSDHTVRRARTKGEDQSNEIPFKIIEESLPGKSNALRKGIAVSRYEFIIICDDDNLLATNYVQVAYDIMAENPEVGFLGGCGLPKTEGRFPEWFNEYKMMYACGSQSQNGNDITEEKEYVYGAGAVFRKSIFEGLNMKEYFKVLPGRKGSNLVGGEDNLMGYLAIIVGFKIWYSDRLKFIHKIPRDRLTLNYLANLKYANGRAQIYLEPFTDYIRNESQPEGVFKQIITNVKHILSSFKHNGFNLFRKNKVIHPTLILYYYLGKIEELMRLNLTYQKEYQKRTDYCKSIKHKKK